MFFNGLNVTKKQAAAPLGRATVGPRELLAQQIGPQGRDGFLRSLARCAARGPPSAGAPVLPSPRPSACPARSSPRRPAPARPTSPARRRSDQDLSPPARRSFPSPAPG